MRVENMVGPGTPDVEYIGGWIELKQVDEWPKREATPLRVDHFTPQQKAWLIRRRLRGGRAFVLIRVANDWLLIDGTVAAKILGSVPKDELISKSIKHWHGRLDSKELLKCLTS